MLDQLQEALALERPSLESRAQVVGQTGGPAPRAFGMDQLEAACAAAHGAGREQGYSEAWANAEQHIERVRERARMNGETTGALGALRCALSAIEDLRPSMPPAKAPRFEQGEARGQREVIDELVAVFGQLAQQIEREGTNGERQAQDFQAWGRL